MRGVVAAAILLTATAAQAQSPGPATTYQRDKLVGWARNHFADPYSLRSTGISNQMMLRTYSGGQHLGICIEYNAKNLEGAYTGIDRFPFIVGADGRVAEGRYGMLTNTSCYDEHVSFRPFPELMAIR